MNKLNVSNLSSFEQSILDILVKGFVFTALLSLNWPSTAISGGSIQLPYPALTLPVLTLLISQVDSYFIAWAGKENIPIPPRK